MVVTMPVKFTTSDMPIPRTMPMTPPIKVSAIASMRNCRLMSALLRADGFAQADLARALRHGREHHVHDADAADEKRDAGDGARGGA